MDEKDHDLYWNAFQADTQLEILYKMTITYFYSALEILIKKVIKEILVAKPEIMKSFSNIKVEISEIVEIKDNFDINSLIADKIVEKLSYKNIDEIKNEINGKFGIDFTEYDKWVTLREGYYRRNLIVHNGGKISKIYLEKVKNIKKGIIDDELYLSYEYVDKLSLVILGFCEFIINKINAKFFRSEEEKDFEKK